MKDILPEEMEKREWIYSKIEPVFKRYGFRKAEPTFVEHLDTLKAKSGDAVLAEVYHFKDKGGRELGLRFDLTVGMARMVASSFDMPEPIKLYAVSPMWRYDEPQFGRYRCFWQWDVEVFGSEEASADAEVMAVCMNSLEEVGLSGVKLKISNRRLVESILKAVGAETQDQVTRLFRALDKSAKISRPELEQLLLQVGLSREQSETLLSITQLTGGFDQVSTGIGERLPRLGGEGLGELGKVWDELGSLGYTHKAAVDLGVVRGLDYYDGTVFEGVDEKLPSAGSIFGGGRYDQLTALYGKRTLPATGAAGGVERLILSLEAEKVFAAGEKPVDVLVAAASPEYLKNAAHTCMCLRKAGIRSEYPLKRWSLRRQLEYADAVGKTHVVVIGKREAESGLYALKVLKSGEQRLLTLEDVVAVLSGRL